MTFEGFYEWMVHAVAFAENEWKNAQQWNPSTELTLAPGESKTYGVKFLFSDSIRGIESSLAANGRPVAVGMRALWLHYPNAKAVAREDEYLWGRDILVAPVTERGGYIQDRLSAGWRLV
jgi:hypothetical protein